MNVAGSLPSSNAGGIFAWVLGTKIPLVRGFDGIFASDFDTKIPRGIFA